MIKDIVLITGPTGFVGFKTLLTALEAGHNVRAVIRKPEQAQKIKTHVKIAPHVDRLEFAVVPVLTDDGAFNDVLANVVAILHIASPLAIETDDYVRDIIDPAIQMSTSILYSALKVPTIRRIIITSSIVTLIPYEWSANPDNRIYRAKDLNPKLSRSANHPMEAYWSSKGLARAAVKDFVETHKPHFEIIQILPGVIIGADDRAATTADLRNNTPQWTLRMSPILGEKQSEPMVSVPVDVVDVARAHVDAMKPSITGSTDYTLCVRSSESILWDDMIEVAKKYFQERAGSKEMPLGGTLPTTKFRVDSKETEIAFGWKLNTFENTMKSMIGQYLTLLDGERKTPGF